MSLPDPTTLTKNVYTKVLTNVTYLGTVYIVDQDEEPTSYEVAFVDTGDTAPDNDKQGIVFDECFSPTNTVASDFYVKPNDYDGKVIITI